MSTDPRLMTNTRLMALINLILKFTRRHDRAEMLVTFLHALMPILFDTHVAPHLSPEQREMFYKCLVAMANHYVHREDVDAQAAKHEEEKG